MSINSNQRAINIISAALKLNFEFNEIESSFQDVVNAAQEFLIEVQTDIIEFECEVERCGNHQQVTFPDGYGYTYWCEGDIVSFSAHWGDPVGSKVYHSEFINSIGQKVRLYYLVQPTHENVPSPEYVYNTTTGQHELFARKDHE